MSDIEIIEEVDKSGMLKTILGFPEQIEEAVNIGYNLKLKKFKPENIVIAGMGGSGISGHIISAWCSERVPVPMHVCSDYNLPAFVGKETLLICASYSGNTEETLSAFARGLKKGAYVVGISSGGKLEEFCSKTGVPHVKIKSGMQPREATAYMLFPMIAIMDKLRIFEKKRGLSEEKIIDAKKEIQDAIDATKELRERIKPDVGAQENPAKKVSQFLLDRIPVIFGYGIYAPIAKRWRTQLNENSKVLGWDDVLPELNHNETVAWDMDYDPSRFAVVLLRDEDESPQLKTRIDFTSNLVKDRGGGIINVVARGKSPLAKMMYAMCLGDCASIYLAILRGIDPTPVDIISELKENLEQIGTMAEIEKELFG